MIDINTTVNTREMISGKLSYDGYNYEYRYWPDKDQFKHAVYQNEKAVENCPIVTDEDKISAFPFLMLVAKGQMSPEMLNIAMRHVFKIEL